MVVGVAVEVEQVGAGGRRPGASRTSSSPALADVDHALEHGREASPGGRASRPARPWGTLRRHEPRNHRTAHHPRSSSCSSSGAPSCPSWPARSARPRRSSRRASPKATAPRPSTTATATTSDGTASSDRLTRAAGNSGVRRSFVGDEPVVRARCSKGRFLDEGERRFRRRATDAREAEPTGCRPGKRSLAHGRFLYTVAYRLTGDDHDAQDLVQEVLLRVQQGLATYQPGSMEGWLSRIATNAFLDDVRRRKRRPAEALPDDPERVARGRARRPTRRSATRRCPTTCRQALRALPDDYRAAVVLCDVVGLQLRGDRRVPRRPGRHGAQPHPPRPLAAEGGAVVTDDEHLGWRIERPPRRRARRDRGDRRPRGTSRAATTASRSSSR